VYTVASAQVPEPPEGADRIVIVPNAVIVLDGASAFGPANPDPAAYVDCLGNHLRHALTSDPRADLSGALAAAIEATAAELELTPGLAPSSTVAIARWIDDRVDLLVLGDSQITTPLGTVRDSRLDSIGVSERSAYRSRLAGGHGYDAEHRALLVALQTVQAAHRNRPNGYWIAEADPTAAAHAITESHPLSDLPWLVLATDGAYRPLSHLGLSVDPGAVPDELAKLLRACERWEKQVDPAGTRLPRSKRHDDKSVVTLQRSRLPWIAC
jgi:hypothetical protein